MVNKLMIKVLGTFSLILILYIPIFGQVLTLEQKKFITENAVSIQVNKEYQNGNWSPVLNAVKDKRLVLLGEFNHGCKEVFNTRNDLIKELYKNLGFDLILFESGVGEVGIINLNSPDSSNLTQGFFGGWRTAEFENLVQFAIQNNIQIGGFDVQRTGSVFTDYLSPKLSDQLNFQELEEKFVQIKNQLANFRTDFSNIENETLELKERYQQVFNNISESDKLAKRTLENRVEFLTYMIDFARSKDWNARWKARDLALASNIKWHLNLFEPDQKAIIIAHNFHISKSNEKEEVMGQFLEKDFGNEMYVLGVFAKEGSYLNNSGEEEFLSKPDSISLDIKHIIEADKTLLSFLNFPKTFSNGSKWLQEPMIVNDTFIDLSNSNQLILSKSFDGLLLFDTVSPPTIKW